MLARSIATDGRFSVLEMSSGGCWLVENRGTDVLKIDDVLPLPDQGWPGSEIEIQSSDRNRVIRLKNLAWASDPGEALRGLRFTTAEKKRLVRVPPYRI
jgi:hypothetical protein